MRIAQLMPHAEYESFKAELQERADGQREVENEPQNISSNPGS